LPATPVPHVSDLLVRRGNVWVEEMIGRRQQKRRIESPCADLFPDYEVVLSDPSQSGQSGRGSVTLVQRPTRSNEYTARIRIENPEGSKDSYVIVLEWKR
jgi:hypothetical protein